MSIYYAMRTIALLLVLSFYPISTLFCQEYYSKNFDFYNKNLEEVLDFVLYEDTIAVRGNVFDCNDPEKSCSYLGYFSTSTDSFSRVILFDSIQGGVSLISEGDYFFLSSEERPLLNSISVSKISKKFEVKKTEQLHLLESRYYSYTIKKSIVFGGKLIVGGQALDSLDKINTSSGWADKEKAFLYVLDSNLFIDTVLLVSPTPGRTIKIEDFAIGSDSVLYVSFYHQMFNGNYFEYRKSIYGYDKNLNQVFSWTGPDAGTKFTGRSSILIKGDSTIFINYTYGFRTFLLALNHDGTKKWECPFDSTFIQGGFYGLDIVFAKNGDIIGSGQIESAFHGIGTTGYLFRISPNGTMKWNKVFRVNKGVDTYSSMKDYGYVGGFNCVTELSNGSIMAGGRISMFQGKGNPLGEYNNDLWMVKTDSNGCIWKDCPYIQDILVKNNYIPFVAPENEWVIDYFPLVGSPEIRRYTFSKDSVLKNGKFYHEFIYLNNSSPGIWIGTSEFYREENGAVYKLGGLFSGNMERIIFDFNAGIGDTLIPNTNLSQRQREIVAVSAITLLDGVPRKKLTIGGDDCSGTVDLIEGMGDSEFIYTAELFCVPIADGPALKIRCFSTNNQLVYQRPGLNDCNTSSTYEPDKIFLSIEPNPAIDWVVFKLPDFPQPNPSEFRVVNLLGECVRNIPKTDNENIVQVSDLPSGVYFVLVSSKGSLIGVKKLIIAH